MVEDAKDGGKKGRNSLGGALLPQKPQVLIFQRSMAKWLRVQSSGSNSVVECQLPKLDVVGSSPISRSNSSAVR